MPHHSAEVRAAICIAQWLAALKNWPCHGVQARTKPVEIAGKFATFIHHHLTGDRAKTAEICVGRRSLEHMVLHAEFQTIQPRRCPECFRICFFFPHLSGEGLLDVVSAVPPPPPPPAPPPPPPPDLNCKRYIAVFPAGPEQQTQDQSVPRRTSTTKNLRRYSGR